MAPGTVQHQLSREMQLFPLVTAMTSPPSAPHWALASRFTYPGGLNQNDCRGRGKLYFEAKGAALLHWGHHLVTMTQQNQSTLVGNWAQLRVHG